MRIPTLSESPVALPPDTDGLHLPPLTRPTLIRRLRGAVALLLDGQHDQVVDLLSAPEEDGGRDALS